jgi:hypothetical protein
MMPMATSTRRRWPPEPRAGLLGEPDGRDDFVGVARARVERAELGDDLAYGQLAGGQVGLGHDPDAGPPGPVSVRRILAEHGHFPAAAATLAFEDLDRGGLARAVGAEQREHLARLDVQVHAVHGGFALILLAQAANPDGGRGLCALACGFCHGFIVAETLFVARPPDRQAAVIRLADPKAIPRDDAMVARRG